MTPPPVVALIVLGLCLFAVGVIVGAMVPAPGMRLRQVSNSAQRIDSSHVAEAPVYWRMHGYDERGKLRPYLLTQYEIDRIRKRTRRNPEDA